MRLLRLKIWRIEKAIKKLVKETNGIKPMTWSFGAYYIDPKHMAFVIGVPTDKIIDEMRKNDTLVASLKDLLEKFNWPKPARNDVIFNIESQETVDRENNGNRNWGQMKVSAITNERAARSPKGGNTAPRLY